MRIGTAFAQQLAIDGIGERQARLLEGQEQLSSGKRISRPSDDPLAAAEAERIRSRESRIEAEKRTTLFARQMLSNAESTLGDADTLLQSARESLLGANNPTLSPVDRGIFAAQLRQTREQLLAVANRGDGAGGFVFGGQGTPGAPIGTDGTTYAPQAGTQQLGQEMVSSVSLDGRQNFTAVRTGTGTESVFAGLDAAIAALEAPGSTAAGVGPTVRGVIDTVDRTMERLGVTRTMVGERLRALDAHEQALESGSIELQARLSDLVDLDFAKGVSTMLQNQTTLEAAMKSYAQIARLTLFDYI
jgi:flagellar hook-associated protein 3 FlgL